MYKIADDIYGRLRETSTSGEGRHDVCTLGFLTLSLLNTISCVCVGGWGDINKRKREGKMATQEVVNHLHTA